LLLVVMHAEIARESGQFKIDNVVPICVTTWRSGSRRRRSASKKKLKSRS
jgi:hypothetical protein